MERRYDTLARTFFFDVSRKSGSESCLAIVASAIQTRPAKKLVQITLYVLVERCSVRLRIVASLHITYVVLQDYIKRRIS